MNQLLIGNIKATALAKQYGTPLYVYDEKNMERIMNLYLNNFKSNDFKTDIVYASKAFSLKEMLRLVNRKGLCLDCVSLGELITASSVSFPFEKIYFHGNNKSKEELEYAIKNSVGHIIVDNYMELEAINQITSEMNKDINVLIRLNVGVEAHTHKYIVTGHIDSKFGMAYTSPDFKKCLELINSSKHIKFDGFSSHIGSQIFDMSAFFAAIDKLILIIKDFKESLILDIGGGFGITYTSSDKPLPLDYVSSELIKYTETKLKENNVSIQKLVIEPGRSIVAESGYTLYTIGYMKKTPNKEYYFIDGGMTDNIRPALYQAAYAADIANKIDLPKTVAVTVAGKCCESGDIIIEKCLLPKADVGDILVTYSTGAYGYSMSNNYNKALTPAIVFVNGDTSRLVSRRMTYEELIEREI